MSISSVNPYTSIMAAYKVATVGNKQSNAPLGAVENTQANPANRPSEDTVSISDAGHAKSQASSIQTQAQEMYEKYFKPSGMIYIPLEKPINELLPENQALIQTLRDEQANTPSLERRQEIQARISLISAYGDAEVFHNEAEVAERREVLHLATNMLFKETDKQQVANTVDVGKYRDDMLETGKKGLSELSIEDAKNAFEMASVVKDFNFSLKLESQIFNRDSILDYMLSESLPKKMGL
jgi:hypothetical protein